MAEQLTRNRKFAVVLIAATSAVATPPDPLSMLAMMAVLICGYETLLHFCRWRQL